MVRSPCCDENNLKKGPWTPEEDQKLVDHINKHGYGNWKTLPKSAGLNRCGKSCRLRWTNYLRPDIKRGRFSEEEERIIINLHSFLGNKWSRIATHLPGRTDNEIKNFWNTNLRKKLLQMGIDPTTHKPRTDMDHLLNLSQLLCAAQFGSNLMNPWENIALKLQRDTTQLAKVQWLQNMLQVINSSTIANNNESNGFLGIQNANPIEIMSTGSLISAGLCPPPPQATNEHRPEFSNFWTTSMELGGTEQEGLLPLISASPDTSNFRQMEGKNTTIDHLLSSTSTPPNSSTSFEDWEKFIMDDETGDSCWKDILDLTSSSSPQVSW